MFATAGAAVAGFALALVTPLAAATAATSSPSPAGATQLRAAVIAVPDLRWSDLAYMPGLQSFAATAAVGDLSVKTATSRADCNDGMLSFSAGDRVDSKVARCGLSDEQLTTDRHRAADSSFDAHVGSLGQALEEGGFGTVALNLAAVPILADRSGRVEGRPDQTALPPRGPTVDAIVDDALYVGRPDQRPATARALDEKIDEQIAELSPQTTVMIVGLSDAATGHAHLHVLLVHQPGWGHVELARPATGPPYVALIDLAPTLLHLLGRPPPADMAGRVLHPTGTPARAWTAYADQDRHAEAARSASKPLRYALAFVALAILLLLVFSLRTRELDSGAAAMWLARLAVGVPVFAFLVQLLPWWRDSSVIVAVMFGCGAIAFALAVGLAVGRGATAALVVVPAVTALVLFVDQLAGAPLQISAPLGDSPLIGGRFHGMGNTDFAIFATAALLCAGVAGGALVARGRRSLGVAVAAGVGLVAVVVDGAPPLGDDAGGAVTLLAAVALMLAVLAGVGVTWRRAAVVLGAAVVVVVLVGVADHARGAGSQTHLGRFVGQLMHGGAGTDVRRRLVGVATSFGNVPLTILVVATAVVAVTARAALRQRLDAVPGLAAALAGVAAVAVLGTVLNDSGVVVGAFAVIVSLTAVVGAGLLTVAAEAPPVDQAG